VRRVSGLLAVLVALVAAAASAWLALGDRASTLLPAGGADAPVESGSESGPAARRAAGRARPPTEEAAPGAATGPSAAEPTGESGAAPVRASPDETPILVRVKGSDGATAGLSVAILGPFEGEGLPPEIEAAKSWDEIVAAVLSRGRALEPDSVGHLRIPRFAGRAVVAAKQGGLSGLAWIDADRATWDIWLGREATLDVVVRDAAGRPCADVIVLLATESDDGQIPRGSAVTVEPDGAARISGARTNALAFGERHVVTVALPFAQRPRADVDLEKPSAQPVVLRLPETGIVRCEVAEGAAADGRVVRLRRLAKEARSLVVMWRDGDPNDTCVPVRDGAAVFARVGLGLELEAEVPGPDESQASIRRRFAGPRLAGEVVTVRLEPGGEKPVVTGRPVDGNGDPLCRRRFSAHLAEPEQRPGEWGTIEPQGRTDEAGRFRIVVDRPMEVRTGIQFGMELDDRGASGFMFAAWTELPRGFAQPETDVGDIRVAGIALVASGVVVDAAGKRVAGAKVRAMEANGEVWEPIREIAAVKTGPSGEFRLRGDGAAAQVPVGVTLEGRYVADPAPVQRGTTGVRLVLAEAGSIAGSVGERVRNERLEVVVAGDAARNGDAEMRFHGGISVFVDDEGRFEVRSLRPGRARVAILRGAAGDRVAAEFEDVEVVGGKVTHDPRLQGIALPKDLAPGR
jgi:hypothetical protein